MGKSIKGTTKKRRGRPATTGKGTQLGMRWHDPMLVAIDSWREKHDVATRAEAIRRLVELALKAKAETPAKSAGKTGRRARAAELAAKTIEKMIDPSATPDERDQRRRRLTKGPPEFREDRVDLPKAKGK
jgi:hypothetical protein